MHNNYQSSLIHRKTLNTQTIQYIDLFQAFRKPQLDITGVLSAEMLFPKGRNCILSNTANSSQDLKKHCMYL